MTGVLVIEDDDRRRLSLVLDLEDEGYAARLRALRRRLRSTSSGPATLVFGAGCG